MKAHLVLVAVLLVGCAADTGDDPPPYGASEVKPGCTFVTGVWNVTSHQTSEETCLELARKTLDFDGQQSWMGLSCTMSGSGSMDGDTCTYSYALECGNAATSSETFSWSLALHPGGSGLSGQMTGVVGSRGRAVCSSSWDVKLTH